MSYVRHAGQGLMTDNQQSFPEGVEAAACAAATDHSLLVLCRPNKVERLCSAPWAWKKGSATTRLLLCTQNFCLLTQSVQLCMLSACQCHTPADKWCEDTLHQTVQVLDRSSVHQLQAPAALAVYEARWAQEGPLDDLLAWGWLSWGPGARGHGCRWVSPAW